MDEYANDATSLPGPLNVTGQQTNALTAATPAVPHPAYLRTKPRRDKCRALFDGTPAIRDGKETYLPRLANESNESYDFRRVLCALFNAYQRTIKASVGIMLSTDPELGDDMPQILKDIAEDLDLKGTHLSVYTERLATDGMIDGYAGSTVDYPTVDNPFSISSADDKASNARPYCVRYLANDILQIRYGKIDGVMRKTMVVVREQREEVRDLFRVVEITRYLVYRHTKETGVTWESWESDEFGANPVIKQEPKAMNGKGAKPLTRIPFSVFAPGVEKGVFEWTPTMENLADLNIEHHQIKTNLRNLEVLACVPTLVRVGARPIRNADGEDVYPEIELGPRGVIDAPTPEHGGQPLYWLSPDISVLAPGQASLHDIKADMGAAGLAFLSPDMRRAETAEAKRIDSAAQNATITSVSRKLQDHLEELFQMLAEFTGDVAGSVTMNRDFQNTVLDAPTLAALGAMAANGNLSIDTLHTVMERGGILPEGFDNAAELEKIMKQNALPPAPVPTNTPPANPADTTPAATAA